MAIISKEVFDKTNLYNLRDLVTKIPYSGRALFQAEIAESVIDRFEKYYSDTEPRQAIAAIRAYHKGLASRKELDVLKKKIETLYNKYWADVGYRHNNDGFYRRDYGGKLPACLALEAVLSAVSINTGTPKSITGCVCRILIMEDNDNYEEAQETAFKYIAKVFVKYFMN